jgi:hypothetical protein
MLGVAAETWILETAAKYVAWAGSKADKFSQELDNPKRFYVRKLELFFSNVKGRLDALPAHLRETFDLDVTSILQLIRLTRNEAGHATGATVDEEACFSHLIVYARAHRHLHELQDHFDTTKLSTAASATSTAAQSLMRFRSFNDAARFPDDSRV